MFHNHFNSFLSKFSESLGGLPPTTAEREKCNPDSPNEIEIINKNLAIIESNCCNLPNIWKLLKSSNGFYKIDVIQTSLIVEPSIEECYILTSAVTKRDHKGETILHKKCKIGNVDQVLNLLTQGHDPNVQDYAGWTPLHEAVVAQKIEVAKLLLNYGALINIPGFNYVTVLHQAVLSNNVFLTKLLISYGADVTALNLEGHSPVNLCNNQEMMTTLCLTPRNQNIFQVYTIPEPKIYFLSGTKEDINKAKQNNIIILNYHHLLAGEVNYAILGPNKPNIKQLQFAMLQGTLVIETRWLDDFVGNTLPLCPTNYLVSMSGFALEKAAKNKFKRNPKLFHEIEIYFCFQESPIINEVEYTIKDLKLLVELGGGKVSKRRPSRISKLLYPYHGKIENSVPTMCYFIYNQNTTNFEEMNYEGLKHRSVNWLIECVNKFCIL